MRSTAAAVVAVVCLATAVTAATTVLEIADDAGSVTIGTTLDTALTRRSAGVLGAANFLVDNVLNVTGPTSLGSATGGPVTMKNNLNVQGTTTLNGATNLAGAYTANGAGTIAGTATFNAQATFNNLPPQVNTNLYVTGIIHHGNAAYHRTRYYGMTAKIYAGAAQSLGASAVSVVGFSAAAGLAGTGSANDGWQFAAQKMWGGTDTSAAPTPGFGAFGAQNSLVPPTDPATNLQMGGFFRLSASINVGGCSEQGDATTNARSTTWRTIYFAIGTGPLSLPSSLKFYGGSTVRELYPKEASLSITETVLLVPGQSVFLAFSNNCITNAVSTIQPMAPPVAAGGAPQAMPGLHATLSMTYIGE